MSTVTLSAFYVIGISVRTSNVNNKALKDIGDLFGIFFGQNIMQKIPNKLTEEIYCVYTDYESDYKGPYTTIIGCKVSSLTDIPSGLVGKTIPQSNYEIYRSAGKLSVSLKNTWEGIWSSNHDRRYTADFDIYGDKASDPENAEVDTYVAIN